MSKCSVWPDSCYILITSIPVPIGTCLAIPFQPLITRKHGISYMAISYRALPK